MMTICAVPHLRDLRVSARENASLHPRTGVVDDACRQNPNPSCTAPALTPFAFVAYGPRISV